MTPEQLALARAESARATERARAVLQPGDRLSVTLCGGGRGTVTMIGWDRTYTGWIYSKTRDDIHASHILKVNGVPTSFRDEGRRATDPWPQS